MSDVLESSNEEPKAEEDSSESGDEEKEEKEDTWTEKLLELRKVDREIREAEEQLVKSKAKRQRLEAEMKELQEHDLYAYRCTSPAYSPCGGSDSEEEEEGKK